MTDGSLPNIVAIDLGAESCRVSLLHWDGAVPRIEVVHRFSNAPVGKNGSLFWDLQRILFELERGLILADERCSGPIASIAVDGWAVDYVRLNDEGVPLGQPFCYRDSRTEEILEELHRRTSPEKLFAESGTQPLRINTLYQLMADSRAGVPASAPWVNLPEYVLGVWAGRFVAEYTNATHTGLVNIREGTWSKQVFADCGLKLAAAPEIVPTGTEIGSVNGTLRRAPSFRNARLIAPACHDTASAIAAIPLDGDDWAYISCGTWSLVGTLIDAARTSAETCAAGFTNLGAAGGGVCFHKNVNGMWLLKQTQQQLCPDGDNWLIEDLIRAAEEMPVPDCLFDVDDPALLPPGPMASRVNAQRIERGAPPIKEHPSMLPRFASLIFHSLAARYAEVLRDAERLTGRKFRRVVMMGGGSLNQFLTRLTAQATGLEVISGPAESSTLGNFAVQLATLDGEPNSRKRIAHWSRVLSGDSYR